MTVAKTMKGLWAAIAIVVVTIAGYFTWRVLTTPRYGWLVFGPKADVRMLLRADEGEVSIDLDRDGRFDRAERIKDVPRSIPSSDGRTSYVITRISNYEDNGRRHLTIQAEVKGAPEFRQLADLQLSRTRQGAATAHFNGPLEVQVQTIYWEVPKDLVLRRGDKGTDMRVNIGTIRKEERCWTTVFTQNETNAFFATNVFPWLAVEFPSRTGTSPVLVRYPLDRVC
jgi:hypothetical protein